MVGPDGKPIPGAEVEVRGDLAPTFDQVRRGKFISKERYGSNIHADAGGKIVLAFPRDPARLVVHITIPG